MLTRRLTSRNSALPLNNYSTDLAVLRTYSDAITESFYTEVVPICGE